MNPRITFDFGDDLAKRLRERVPKGNMQAAFRTMAAALCSHLEDNPKDIALFELNRIEVTFTEIPRHENRG